MRDVILVVASFIICFGTGIFLHARWAPSTSIRVKRKRLATGLAVSTIAAVAVYFTILHPL